MCTAAGVQVQPHQGPDQAGDRYLIKLFDKYVIAHQLHSPLMCLECTYTAGLQVISSLALLWSG